MQVAIESGCDLGPSWATKCFPVVWKGPEVFQAGLKVGVIPSAEFRARGRWLDGRIDFYDIIHRDDGRRSIAQADIDFPCSFP